MGFGLWIFLFLFLTNFFLMFTIDLLLVSILGIG